MRRSEAVRRALRAAGAMGRVRARGLRVARRVRARVLRVARRVRARGLQAVRLAGLVAPAAWALAAAQWGIPASTKSTATAQGIAWEQAPASIHRRALLPVLPVLPVRLKRQPKTRRAPRHAFKKARFGIKKLHLCPHQTATFCSRAAISCTAP